MNFFRIMYLDENRKKKRMIVETSTVSKAILNAIMILSKKCVIISHSLLKPYEIRRLRILEQKEERYSRRIISTSKPSSYPIFVFEKEVVI